MGLTSKVAGKFNPPNVAWQDYDGFWDGKDAISKVSGLGFRVNTEHYSLNLESLTLNPKP